MTATSSTDAVFVHPSADVEDGAQIGAGTKIWHIAHVRSTAKIGGGCVIGRNVYVDADVVIGDLVKIQNNVSVYPGVTLEDESSSDRARCSPTISDPGRRTRHWQSHPDPGPSGRVDRRQRHDRLRPGYRLVRHGRRWIGGDQHRCGRTN